MTTRRQKPLGKLWVTVGGGLLVGALYTLVDAYLDREIGTRLSEPPEPIELFHAVIDHVLPPVTGALVGVTVHYVRLRARMAELERSRADELSSHLHKLERDQAVWVISASLLHELKNPLHSLGLLLDEALELPEERRDERRVLLERARAQGERLTTRLATLRSLPHSPRPELPEIDLTAVVGEVLGQLRPVAQSSRVELVQVGDDVRARANPAYLRLAIENLVENGIDALRDAGRSGAVVVHVARENDHAVLLVRDEGPGIAEELRPHLFEPFHSSKPSGLGLGLAIARTLTQAMGGELSLEPGGQTSFRLELRGDAP